MIGSLDIWVDNQKLDKFIIFITTQCQVYTTVLVITKITPCFCTGQFIISMLKHHCCYCYPWIFKYTALQKSNTHHYFLVKMSNSKLFNCIPEQIHLFQWLNFMLVWFLTSQRDSVFWLEFCYKNTTSVRNFSLLFKNSKVSKMQRTCRTGKRLY